MGYGKQVTPKKEIQPDFQNNGSSYNYGGFESPSLMGTAKDLMNTGFGKGAKMGIKTYKQISPPELAGAEDIVDPEMMALNRMRRY